MAGQDKLQRDSWKMSADHQRLDSEARDFGPWGNLTKFVVLTRGRTGSSAIASDLGTHPAIFCQRHAELFTRRAGGKASFRAPTYMEMQAEYDRFLTGETYLKNIVGRFTDSTTRAFGFKLLLTHFEERRGDIDFWRMMRENDFRVIYLVRNPVRAAISIAIANARGVWSRVRRSDLNPEPGFAPVAVDAQRVVDEVSYGNYWRQQVAQQLDALPLRHITVSYEEYVSDRDGLINRLFRFLDVSPFKLTEPNAFHPMTQANFWDDIANAEEVKKAIVAAGNELPPAHR